MSKFNQLRANGIPVSGTMLKTIAKKYATNYGDMEFKASNGWLHKFKLRGKLRYKKLCGERMSCDFEAAEEYILNFPEISKGFSRKDIFNCDESGLYIRGMSSKSFTFEGEDSGSKIDKERLSVLFGCSLLGEKLPLMIIGRSKKPRCLKGYDFETLGLMYDSNASAWMISYLFEKWLIDVNNIMRAQNRNILLIMDNCKAHIPPPLSNVSISFHPPNMTPILQPLDQGIIKNVKDRYQGMLMDYIVDFLDDGDIINSAVPFKTKKITILYCILWLYEIWKDLPAIIIVNCWNHSRLSSATSEELYEENDGLEIVPEADQELQSVPKVYATPFLADL